MKQGNPNWLKNLHQITLHGICSGVSKNKNEVAGRIRFLAKFRKPKTIIMSFFVVLLLGVGVFCLAGNNPVASNGKMQNQSQGQGEDAPDVATNATESNAAESQNDAQQSGGVGASVGADTRKDYTIWQADLLHDGTTQKEEILWDPIAFADTMVQPLYVQQADSEQLPTQDSLWQTSEGMQVSTSHVGNQSYSLYTDETGDYLLRYCEAWYNGSCEASYELFYLSDTGEEVIVASDTAQIWGEEMPYNSTLNDVDHLISFSKTVMEYFAKSYVLVSTLNTTGYYDVTTQSMVQFETIVLSTKQQPVILVPSFLLDVFAPQSASDMMAEDAADVLRAKVEALNKTRAENYAKIQAEIQLENEQQMEEIGMVEPFTATPTYIYQVAESYEKNKDALPSVAHHMNGETGVTLSDQNGNEITYSLQVITKQGALPTTQYNSNLLWNSTYWDGVYLGDLPDSSDRAYYDFYYVQDFKQELSCAKEIPAGATLQLTVDGSAQGNHKTISMVACRFYSSNGTNLFYDSVFAAQEGKDGKLTLTIPSLDYQGEEQMIIKFTIVMQDETTPHPEDYHDFSFAVKVPTA